MRTLRHLLDYLSGTTIHIDWYFLGATMIVCTLIAGWAVRRL
jgi:hypothetical protein